MQVAIDKSDGLGRIEASEYALSENDIRNVKRAQAGISRRNYKGAKIANASDFNEDNKKESLWSMIKEAWSNCSQNYVLSLEHFAN